MAKQQKNQGNKKGGGPMHKSKAVQEGQVKKNNSPKFAQTPKGKVALINEKNAKKPNNKNQSPVQKQVDNKSPKKGGSKKNNNKGKKTEVEEDSDEDINEGIVLPEDSIIEEEDDDDDSSVGDETPINILGESLAEQSDSDDEDFEASDDEEVDNKGIKMFKGIKPSADKSSDADSSLNTSVASAATEEDDDDDDDDSEDEAVVPGLKALMDTTMEDDEDDEDFEGDDDEEEDDDDDDIDSDEDDEDDNEVSDQNQSKNSSLESPTKPQLSPEEKAEVDRRTIFIGNVPKDAKESRIKSEFTKYGPIESLRIRGVVPPSPKIPVKVAAQKRKIHEKVHSICVFIIFKNEESAVKALTMNGKKFEGCILRVDRCNQKVERDPKKAIFVGNVPFDVQDNELWETFGKCGKIDHVRTVRDRFTGSCRGVAYINFKTADGATLALDLNETKIRDRVLRVNRYTPGNKKPRHNKGNKKRPMTGKNQTPSPKKLKSEEDETATKNSVNAERRKDNKAKRSQGQQQRTEGVKKETFQGQKAEGKNNNKKPGKFEKKKKAMAGKLMAKPKKPVA